MMTTRAAGSLSKLKRAFITALLITHPAMVYQALATTVSDTVNTPGNSTSVFGTITATLSDQCTGPSNKTVKPIPVVASVTRGAFTITLEPNDTCSVGGAYPTYYSVTYVLRSPQGTWTYKGISWVVPTSGSTLTVEAVETLPSVVAPATSLAISGLTGATDKAVAIGNSGGSLSFDSLYYDVTNDRLGIGTSTPSTTIHLISPTTTTLRLQIGASQGSFPLMQIYNAAGTSQLAGIGVDGGYFTTDGTDIKSSHADGYVLFSGDAISGLYWCSGSHLGSCGTTDTKLARSAAGILYLADSGGGTNGGIEAVRTLYQETSSHPTEHISASAGAEVYVKDDKYIVRYNHGGTVKYRYLDLTSTDATWTYTTSAP